jgi:hypothetical protein
MTLAAGSSPKDKTAIQGERSYLSLAAVKLRGNAVLVAAQNILRA